MAVQPWARNEMQRREQETSEREIATTVRAKLPLTVMHAIYVRGEADGRSRGRLVGEGEEEAASFLH
jgi:hypothetical protein